MKFKNVEDIYPLSPTQQGILFHNFYDPHSAMYFEIITWTIHGALDVDAFERAWQAVVDRHTILRTFFVWEGLDEPLQVVRRRAPLRLHTEDWRGLADEEQGARLEEYFASERERGFDLSSAPLMRAALMRTADDVHRFVWSYHHVLIDGWSVSVVFGDVFNFYEAFRQGQECALKPARPFREYISWQRQQDLSEAEEFWRRLLRGMTEPTPLGAGQGAAAATRLYEEEQILLTPELTSALQSLARKHKLTLNTIFQGAWALLLSRYGGSREVVFGVAVSGRPPQLTDIESMVGMLVNTLPARVRVEPERELLPWLAELQERQAEMRRYEYTPLVQIQGWSDVPRGTPLFESIVAFENHPIDGSLATASGSGAELRDVIHYHTATGYPLNVMIEPGRELLVKMMHDAGRFDARTARRMLGHFARLLENIAADASARLGEIEMLDEAARALLLGEFGGARTSYPRDLCVQELFERQADATPDAIAVEYAGETLTYRELNERASTLAAHLRTLGVGPEVRVGICTKRSIEMVVGVLGILKAGGAYVPLDPDYPMERLNFMLEDSAVPVLLTQESLLDLLPTHWSHVVCLDADWDEIANSGDTLTRSDVTPDGLAYVIYTSGSTGTPKGVAVSHRAVARLVKDTNYVELSPDDVLLQLAPLSFDASTFELWGALLNGARLVVMPAGAPSLEELGEAIQHHGVTTLWLTAGLFHLMVDGRAEDLRGLRQLLAGGDVLSPAHVRKALEQLGGGGRLINGYGPTENTTFTCCHVMRGGEEFEGSVPIGRPIANTRVYILGEGLRPAPVGVAGELYAAGDGLARGYQGRAALTAEKFMPDPYTEEGGARMYRTGDVARFGEDGEVEFLGRRDNQVKVRGFRIELGEIESALGAHPSVRECVVVARADVPGEKRLVAYVVAEPGAEPQAEELRKYLKERLPDYMTPSAVVVLGAMPLTENGKVDRRALPAPEADRSDLADAFVAPRTPTEQKLASIWASSLGVERVGVNDNFFDLGGHSLLATQVVSGVREMLQVEMPLRSVFDAPTLGALASLIDGATREGRADEPPSIERATRSGRFPLSFAQQRLWFINQLEPGNPFYNVSTAVMMRGRLDHAALEAALGEVVRRHEALRTTFAEDEGAGPAQVVAEPELVKLEVEDLTNEPDAERRASELARAEAEGPFDLGRGPLLRVRLLRLGEEDYLALLTMHHIVSDGWSLGVLLREVAALYEAFTKGEPSPLGELPIQYADFAVWQRERLRGEALEAQLAYWREQLADAPKVLELPTDRPRPALQLYAGATESFIVDAEVTEALKALGRREGATLFMVLLAVFDVLLARHTGQRDIVVGSPIANRNRSETEGLIGFFVNTLALRTKLSLGEPFARLLSRLRETTLGAYEHQDLPFEKLVEELQPERDMGRSPLFQVMFVLQNAPRQTLSLPGLTLSLSEGENRTAKFDLMLTMAEDEGALRAWFEYDTALFDAETVRRMSGHFKTLLRAVAEDPRAEIAALPMLEDDEHRQLERWNETRAEYEHAEECLHELFERQAEATPDAVAVEHEGGRLTYRELNERANRLARHLRARGAGPEVRVALLLERSAEMVVALLGVLKAGGAYVPLDPEYPAERLRFMLADCGAAMLLTERRAYAASGLDAGAARVVLLDERREEISRQRAENLPRAATPDGLAYVIYTSGSTGRPKGAMLAHRGVVNCVEWMQETYKLGERDSFLFKTSLNFDPSVWEVFWPLAVGASIFVAQHGGQQDSAYVADTIGSQRVTVAYFVPSMLSLFLDEPDLASRAASLRYVICGGESLPGEMVRRFQEALPAAELHHSYGPTETSIAASEFLCTRENPRRVMPIGRALANTRLHILDEALEPAPVGAPGELYVGGVCVGRGYHGRASLTAERFIPDPFSTEPGARLYKTGDLARYLPDGNVEFRGRVDAQVKLRGMRIEPGEIEAALRDHRSITDAVVAVRDDAPGGEGLVAYFVARGGQVSTPDELREHLAARLPRHMTPAAFVQLDALPLMPNGKVDRKALPAPSDAKRGEADAYAAPRNAVEELIAGAWADVLGLERVGINDNFFELGGHSLLATQVVARLRSVFHVEVRLRQLFESPTVAGLARSLGSAMRTGLFYEAGEVKTRERRGALPLSFAQQRLWFLEQLEAAGAAYHIPAIFRVKGRLDLAALSRTLGELTRRHETLRTTFRSEAGAPVQIISPPREVSVPVTDLRSMPGPEREREAARLAVEDTMRHFDLELGPLMRASLFRLDEEEYVLALTLHHIISDGWSMGVLSREAVAIYGAAVAGEPSPLEELSVQYADFAEWQREWLQGEPLEEQLSYWHAQLEGAPAVLELATDKPRPTAQTFRGAQAKLTISAALTERLKALAGREGATLFMVLLAAFDVLLSRYAGQEDVVVGSPIANRQRREFEDLIGFFVNTLALRARVRPENTFRELLARVRETTLGAYAHQDVPFERLVEEIQPERELNRNPLFQVMFSLQNTPATELVVPGLFFSAEESANETTRFDLECHLREDGGQILGVFVYSTDLFERATVERMMANFERMLEVASADPERRVGDIPLLTEEEERRQLVEWNDTRAEYPRDACVHQLFEQQAALTPDAIAVEYDGGSLSYAELNARAERLARRLRGAGVGAESVVGICAGRRPETLAAVLAVLKCGGAYMPLDPEYPAARLAYMFENSGARALLTERGLLGLVQAPGAHVLCLDDADAHAEPQPDDAHEAARAHVMPDNAAYVLYTSGSTGRPKGVAMPHRPLVNLVSWQAARSGGRPAPRTLQFATLSFDVSFQEIFSTLCAGGTLVLIDEETHRDPERLWKAIKERRVERLMLPFVALESLADAAAHDEGETPPLREVITAGEQLKITPQLQRLFERLEGCALENQYGPTEAHVVSAHALRGPADAWPELPPVGRPISNARLYVLDARMRPVPPNVAGELYIGGDCLSRGYLGHPETTAERFAPDPFSGEAGARLYRTGDLARLMPCGELQFVGRRDGQLKVRGYRVELAEVEAALASHTLVKEVAVVAREDSPGKKRLVAYLIADGGTPADMRRFLKERLPDYMTPSHFIFLDAFPLTPSGKLDRRALPAPTAAEGEYVPPRTPTEEVLAGIWADVLRLERVGTADNFFDAGGHSLLAAQVVARLREAFRVEMPLRRLFEMPTVAELADEVDAQLRADASRPVLPPITRVEARDRLPLSFTQQRLWFWEQLNPGTPTYTLTSAFRLSGELDADALERSLNEIVRRHEVLRASFSEVDGEPVQHIAASAGVPVESTDLRALPEDERGREARRIAGEEATRPFDLSRAPLLRVRLMRTGEREHVALLSTHHIVSDGWSMGVMVEEVAALYDAFTKGEPSPLPELPVQYADYAVWQREWLRGDALEEQVAYWRERLEGAPSELAMPFDRPRPRRFTARGAYLPFEVPAGLLHDLKALGRREGATLYMTLLAAFKLLLHRHSSQYDLVIGADMANRTRVETEKLIGFFVNMLVLRTDLSGDPTFRELLARVREVTLGAYAHQDVPFATLVDELKVEREPGLHPLFQVVFVLQNAPMGELELKGLTLSPFEFEIKTAPFDLVFGLGETDEGLSGGVTYNTELFDERTIRRMLEHYRRVLEGVVADPDRRLSAVEILSEADTGGRSHEEFQTKLSRKDFESLLIELSQTSQSD